MRLATNAAHDTLRDDDDQTLQGSSREATGVHRASFALRTTSRGPIIGHDEKVRRVLDTIDRVARSSCTVLVTGESGTGKELVVAALHDASPRAEGPLVTINCGAIPSELVESELFGHVRGAFTGAQTARRGFVAAAEGGTLFLDEIGELPMAVQVKLLRLLQQREYTPVGESRPVRCDIRIVAATHRDLEAEVAAGRFREDLYYRLNVIHVHLPSLRERGSDVQLLALHFFRTFAERSGREDDLRGLSISALATIAAHPWPGNVRALENAMERGVLLAQGPFVEAEDILGARGVVEVRRAGIRDARREDESVASAPIIPSIADSGKFMKAPPPEAQVIELPRNMEAMADGPLRTTSNPMFPRVLPDRGVDMFSAVENYQNNLIRQALVRTAGNKNRAAQLLGVNRTTLVEMIRRRGL
jgi:sigma-54 dependent transcriptional regulator, flagellar regulatory protein